MSEEPEETEDAPKKASKLPLILGLVLAIAGGAGGFMAVQMGLLGGGGDAHAEESHEDVPEPDPLVPASFVELTPLTIAIPGLKNGTHLRFSAQLEVPPNYEDEVRAITPRIVDVLNGYLRAVDVEVLEDPAGLITVRSQMLHRVRIVAGEGRINDLLIMEFVPI